MDLGTDAPQGGAQESYAPVVSQDTDAVFNSPNAAAKMLAEMRWAKAREPKEQPAQSSAHEAAPVADELAHEANAAPAEGQPSGETEAIEPEATLPPIDPPASWTKEARERFAALPRETQEYLAERERARDVEVRRSQNEAAEQRKAFEAQRQQVEQARQHYEQALPALLQALTDQHMGEFADIRSIADVQKMAEEDWPRYIKWDAAQKKVAVAQNEIAAAQQRQAAEFSQKWSEFVAEQDKLFLEKAPEFADEKQAPKVQAQIRDYLKSNGLTDQELNALWNGQAGFNLRDHRAQLIIRDAARYRASQEAAKQVAAKPLPPVQRPGVSTGKSAPYAAEIQALESKSSLSLKEAQQLRAMKAAAPPRRAS